MNDNPTRLIQGEAAAAETRLQAPAAAGATAPGAAEPVSLPSTPAQAPLPPGEIVPGTLLAHTFEVQRRLGGGGMGEVYLARHTGLGTLHAVKVIRPAMVAERQVMDLFYREAKVLRGVRHDAVVNYDGFVRDAAGRDYLVMEYADGPSLAERLRQGPLPVAAVLTLRDRLAAGLAEAHRRGAIHRDISPDNVILPGGEVAAAKLIDFGLSKLTDPTQESIIGASFAGKYRFAAPEQFGFYGGHIDARTDMYSLGLVLAAAALGRPLEMGNSFETALAARQTRPDLAGIDPALQPWLAAMLAPDPAERPADLDDLIARWPGATCVVPGRGRSAPAARRPRGAWWAALGVLLLAASGGGLWWFWPVVMSPEPAPGPITAPVARPEPVTRPEVPPPIAPTLPQPSQPAVTAADSDPGLEVPTIADDPFAQIEALRAAGRFSEAFAATQDLLREGGRPPPALLWALADDLRGEADQNPRFFLVRLLANQGFGPAALAFGEMYDPRYWSATTSPFSQPRRDRAEEWYARAVELGEREAAARLQALQQADGGD